LLRRKDPLLQLKNEIRVDKLDRPLPKGIIDDWERAIKVGNENLRKISEVKCALEEAKEQGDVIFAEVSDALYCHVQNSYSFLRCVIPHAVCPTCHGTHRKDCLLCRERGFISKFSWETNVPSEIKELYEKQKLARSKEVRKNLSQND
jgi:hypothetical protein